MDVVRVIGVLEEGGGQLSALRLSQGLRRHGVRTVRLLAGDATPGGVALARRYGADIETYVDPGLGRRLGLQWRTLPGFEEWLEPRLAGADLVHAHMVGAWTAAAAVVDATVPLLASEHNALSWPGGDFTAQAVAAAPRVDAFFAHGPAARAFAAAIGIAPGALHDGRSAVEGLDALPLPDLATPRVTFVGRLHPEKGPDVLVQALARLSRPVTAYLVGDGPAAADIAHLVTELGLAGRVHRTGWSPDPGRYVAGAAVHVVPSREEAWSQSAVVALGLGVPVIGTAVEGLPLTLGDGRGIVVPPEDPAALATAIDGVLDGSRRPDPAPGIAYARHFTIQRIAASYADVYAAVHATARARSR